MQKKSLKKVRGLTLLELMVVLAILAFLGAMVGPAVMNQFSGAKVKTAAIQIADIEKALDLYKLDVGRYPTTQQGLEALVKAPAGTLGWAGPYLSGSLPKDPWGAAYQYKFPGSNGGVELLSLGADSAVGGEGENADIRNRQ